MRISKTVAHLLVTTHSRIRHLANNLAACKAAHAGNQNVSPWIAERSPDFYDGLLQGAFTAMEDLLYAVGQYNGYQELEVQHLGESVTIRVYKLSDKLMDVIGDLA